MPSKPLIKPLIVSDCRRWRLCNFVHVEVVNKGVAGFGGPFGSEALPMNLSHVYTVPTKSSLGPVSSDGSTSSLLSATQNEHRRLAPSRFDFDKVSADKNTLLTAEAGGAVVSRAVNRAPLARLLLPF